MASRRLKIVTLDEANRTALLCNLPGEPAATFNLTLLQPATSGVCKPTSSGLNGTLDLDNNTSRSLLDHYEPDDRVNIEWSPTTFVNNVSFSAVE